eukprot:TRINITY_DN9823_c0_g1_i1.p1 TRINITY_DN9823_c0_g1~~TRINITY_DN9823_c0_g1_i1.p1  ORF type:complete len:296 (-),score=70.38 TRINITY_DN9823_c0_g1_i1:17-904(-)
MYYCSQQCKDEHDRTGEHAPICGLFQKLSTKKIDRDIMSISKMVLKILLDDPSRDVGERWKDRMVQRYQEPLLPPMESSDAIPQNQPPEIPSDQDEKKSVPWDPQLEPFPQDMNLLISHKDTWSEDDVKDWRTMTKVLSKFLPDDKSNEEDLMHLISRIESNNFGLWCGSQNNTCYGRVIYPLASFFNHSCAPNCVTSLDGPLLSILTFQDIKQGEELCISYIDTNLPRSSRRERLLRDFRFLCTCQKCLEEKDANSKENRQYNSSKNSKPNRPKKPKKEEPMLRPSQQKGRKKS